MGKRKDSISQYQKLTPEELHTYIRKNISIPKYMDMFLYENNISLSKLVQNAIVSRMDEIQEKNITNNVKRSLTDKKVRKKIQEKQKENPKFKQELQRARLLLTQYFDLLDQNDLNKMDQKKQLIFIDFPEMYVDIIRFETWYKKNHDQYQQIKSQYDNPIQRLIEIKKRYFKK